MFRGTNPLSLDAKGRLSVPAKYRERLSSLCAGQLIVTIDPTDDCLLIYPLPAWEEVEHQLTRLSSTDPRARALKRLLVGHADECELDKQGRILLAPTLRDYAKLGKETVLLGQGNKFELWDEQIWQQQRGQWLQAQRDNPALAEKLEVAY